MKMHKQSENHFVFYCPACECGHGIDSGWQFNNDMDKPTISPSILATGEKRCHSYVKDGRIEFLGDCSHNLAGKIVEIPDWDIVYAE